VNGVGDPECLGWAGRVCRSARQRGHDITYYNLGVRRDTSHYIERRWEMEATTRLPDPAQGRVVFSFGVNDTAMAGKRRRVELDVSLFMARTILTRAQRIYPTLLVGPPPIEDPVQNPLIAELSAALGQLCGELDVRYLPVFEALSANPVWVREVGDGDRSHPGDQGYAALAELVEGWDAWRAWVP